MPAQPAQPAEPATVPAAIRRCARGARQRSEPQYRHIGRSPLHAAERLSAPGRHGRNSGIVRRQLQPNDRIIDFWLPMTSRAGCVDKRRLR